MSGRSPQQRLPSFVAWASVGRSTNLGSRALERREIAGFKKTGHVCCCRQPVTDTSWLPARGKRCGVWSIERVSLSYAVNEQNLAVVAGMERNQPARRRNRLIPFHAGYNRSNPSFFQITNRFDRTTLVPSATLALP